MLNKDRYNIFGKTAFMINAAMLIIHIFFLVVFSVNHVTFMVIFNLFSLTVYAVSFMVIALNKVHFYISILLFEITSHLIAATICIGWDAGFQLYCFGMIPAIYYTSYLSSSQKGSQSIRITTDIISIATFLSLRWHCFCIPAYYFLEKWKLSVLYTINGAMVFAFVIGLLVAYTKNAVTREKDLKEFADFDQLTGLYNRHKMRDILQDFIDESREGKKNFCVSIIDIDDFKKINDKYGHDAGDYALKSASETMLKIAKETKTYICRWGGEEFLTVTQFDCIDPRGVKKCIDAVTKIQKQVSESSLSYSGYSFRISLTCGFTASRNSDTIESAIKRADNRLYIGKQKGKNCVVTQDI